MTYQPPAPAQQAVDQRTSSWMKCMGGARHVLISFDARRPLQQQRLKRTGQGCRTIQTHANDTQTLLVSLGAHIINYIGHTCASAPLWRRAGQHRMHLHRTRSTTAARNRLLPTPAMLPPTYRTRRESIHSRPQIRSHTLRSARARPRGLRRGRSNQPQLHNTPPPLHQNTRAWRPLGTRPPSRPRLSKLPPCAPTARRAAPRRARCATRGRQAAAETRALSGWRP
jgi:hypothetical protein